MKVMSEDGPNSNSDFDRDILIAMYSAATEQNKLYAEFRWKVLSFMSTLEGALVYVSVQSTQNKHRVLYSVAGIAVTLFLLALEERHKAIFYQARIAARKIEDKLGVTEYGVFNAELKKKGKHNLIVRIWCLALITAWVTALAIFLSR